MLVIREQLRIASSIVPAWVPRSFARYPFLEFARSAVTSRTPRCSRLDLGVDDLLGEPFDHLPQ